jgi:REP element-mobilizing transposase RayT
MTRLARVVIPGLPHHVTQRGNRREAIFFKDGDRISAAGPALRSLCYLLVTLIPRIHSEERLLRGHFGPE